jgi:hypothetical protein
MNNTTIAKKYLKKFITSAPDTVLVETAKKLGCTDIKEPPPPPRIVYTDISMECLLANILLTRSHITLPLLHSVARTLTKLLPVYVQVTTNGLTHAVLQYSGMFARSANSSGDEIFIGQCKWDQALVDNKFNWQLPQSIVKRFVKICSTPL